MTNAANTLREAPDAGGRSSDLLNEALRKLAATVANKAVSSVSDKVLNVSGRLTDYAEGGGGGLVAAVTGAEKRADGESPLKSAVSGGWAGAKEMVKDKASDLKDAVTGGGGGGGGGKKIKVTNIVESIDVGVPIQLAYDQWTQFADFPKFMKKLEQVEQVSDEKLRWQGKVFLSRRSWESTIVEQVPCERIVWRSKGDKGYVDGAVSFHELTPDLTRILVILEYHPHGLFEKTGNIWRAPGRRMRLELKHFQRHVMTQAVLHADELEGWPGEIRDGRVVDTAQEDAEDDPGDDELHEPAEDEEDDIEDDDAEEAPPPKRRGRPRKSATAQTDPTPRRPRRSASTRSSGASKREAAR